MNEKEALSAIKARLLGEWDNTNLEKIGELSTNPTDDILRIIETVNSSKGKK